MNVIPWLNKDMMIMMLRYFIRKKAAQILHALVFPPVHLFVIVSSSPRVCYTEEYTCVIV